MVPLQEALAREEAMGAGGDLQQVLGELKQLKSFLSSNHTSAQVSS